VQIGDRVTVKSGVQLWDGIFIEDDVFIGPNVTFTNDKFPRSKQYLSHYPATIVEKGASIGANATILPGVRIGEGSMIGAGSVITQSVPAFTTFYGNPGRIQGYITKPDVKQSEERVETVSSFLGQRLPGNCRIIALKNASDVRGNLTAIEFTDFSSFSVQRTFFVRDVPAFSVRGEHAHRKCLQFLIAVNGSLTVLLDDGISKAEILLNRPNEGLLIPPMVWAAQYDFKDNAVLGVLASHSYDPNDYIRDYNAFTLEIET
jgi:UDP-2-acetamido-3-amino-2,3-dideoxy-glucuronate N-acetyltransferase